MTRIRVGSLVESFRQIAKRCPEGRKTLHRLQLPNDDTNVVESVLDRSEEPGVASGFSTEIDALGQTLDIGIQRFDRVQRYRLHEGCDDIVEALLQLLRSGARLRSLMPQRLDLCRQVAQLAFQRAKARCDRSRIVLWAAMAVCPAPQPPQRR